MDGVSPTDDREVVAPAGPDAALRHRAAKLGDPVVSAARQADKNIPSDIFLDKLSENPSIPKWIASHDVSLVYGGDLIPFR